MKFTRMRAIIACALLGGVFATPAFGQGYGLIKRGDCPKTAPRMAHVPAHSPVSQYKPVVELERYIASLQTAAPVEAQPRERSRTKRSKRMPSPF